MLTYNESVISKLDYPFKRYKNNGLPISCYLEFVFSSGKLIIKALKKANLTIIPHFHHLMYIVYLNLDTFLNILNENLIII